MSKVRLAKKLLKAGMIVNKVLKATILSDEKITSTRKKTHEIQDNIEGYCNNINPKLGKLSKELNRKLNSAIDVYLKYEDNKSNLSKAYDTTSWMEELNNRKELFVGNEIPKIGDHLYVLRLGYTHHGIYVGENKVVHYLQDQVKEDTLEIFADKSKIRIKNSPCNHVPKEIVNRAYKRIGEDKYNLLFNNCEHFARWCRWGSFEKEEQLNLEGKS